ncbi:cobyric acid synthase [Micropruina sonneratiae]|uniref:cobyric acid synthase n=1 Tax=Micropruina sonneratiae TaxID=2986940 RepID=UPI002227F12F|nr:cobyric acid synthase [Micropruina sp. KQZ13P-5]MCW3158778.1 cobyric acid synthase [Micropruina sp. KQZ13P-5]
MTGLVIAGTSSDAGKSLITAGLCRALQRRGVDVAPFKAQNMSNNSMVCPDGSEIGRAQYLQAQAARLEPTSAMNPVLLKPGTDRRSFIVLRGEPAGTLEAGQYATGRRRLAEAAFAAYAELAAAHELVLCEGAGSPAEINLRAGDYVNFGLAERFDLPVVLCGDIDRGGVLAAIFGTWAIVDDADRALLAGYLINKFRGDQSVLDPGLAELTVRTGLPCLGVVPWLPEVWLDGEDALAFAHWPRVPGAGGTLRVAAVRFPRISNATDLDALAAEPGLDVIATRSPAEVADADLVVLPGSRSTLADLAWLRERGLADAVAQRARTGRPVLGICGGYQMLAEVIDDPVESASGVQPGLGLLPTRVDFSPDKVLGRPTGTWQGHRVEAYEIHHGVVTATGGEPFLDGVRQGAVWGTLWHGAFENDGFRRDWLAEVAAASGSTWRPMPGAVGFRDRRELMLESLADALEQCIDVDAVHRLAR